MCIWEGNILEQHPQRLGFKLFCFHTGCMGIHVSASFWFHLWANKLVFPSDFKVSE